MEPAGVRLQRARHLVEVGRPADALTELSAYLAAAPEDAEALCIAAFCHLAQSDDAAAEQAAAAAIRSQPTEEWGFRLRSLALARLQRFEEALEMAREAVRLAPQAWEAQVQLCLALVDRRRLREADRAAKCAVELAPHESQPHVALALVAERRMRPRKARAALRRALELDPDNAIALNNLAAMDINHGNVRLGTRRLAAALQLAPQERLLHANLDVAAVRLLGKLGRMNLGGAVLLGMLLLAESDNEIAHWWRPCAGAALLVATGIIAWFGIRDFPPGARRHVFSLSSRATVRGRVPLVLWGLALLSVPWLAFLPAALAVKAMGLLVFLVWNFLLGFVIVIVRRVQGWVRGTSRG